MSRDAHGKEPAAAPTVPKGPLHDAPLEETIPADLLKAEVRAWARRIGVEDRVREIHIRAMKSKWASCSSRGRLTFDAALLQQPASFRRQVIVHELLHLKLPNHGPLFRTLLRAFLAQVTDAEGDGEGETRGPRDRETADGGPPTAAKQATGP